MRLMRELRCFPGSLEGRPGRLNSWGGSPCNSGLQTFWVLRAEVAGPIDPVTGYVCTIQALDGLLERAAAVCYRQWISCQEATSFGLGSALVGVFSTLGTQTPPATTLEAVELLLSPYLTFSVSIREPTMIRVTHAFEFSASHRLHCKQWSEQENQRKFGKCAHEGGHGHNYVLEVTVQGRPEPTTGSVLDLPILQRLVGEHVIARLDHKYLNLDCPEFATVNPTVENIVRVVWNLLAPALPQGQLARVRVWETPKTYAEYEADA